MCMERDTEYLPRVLQAQCAALREADQEANYDDPRHDKVLVIVEPRQHPMLEPVVRNHMHFLGEGWNLHIVTSGLFVDWVHGLFPNWKLRVTTLGAIMLNLTRESYSALFLYEGFWTSIREEHILISQTDCIMFHPGIERYLSYDYCGANYFYTPHVAPRIGGIQGGFSLRRRSAMVDCVRRVTWEQMQVYRRSQGLAPIDVMFEDIYFTHACEILQKRVPAVADRAGFSTESEFSPAPIGCHGIDKPYLFKEWLQTIVSMSPLQEYAHE